jgi:hypothetical protein
MATFADLWRSLLPGARPVGPVAESGVPIGWVRVLRPRVPAFDALDPGDLAIVPAAALAVVAPGPDDVGSLVAALAAAPAAGVVIVADASGGDGPAEALAVALASSGLPALLIDDDPVALERRAIGFLVNRRAELDRQAAELERQIERLALAGRGADDLAGAIGAFLGRAVVIERRRGEPLAIHAPAARPSSVALVARYHARPAAVPLRVPLPGAEGRPAGNLVLLGDATSERERVICDRVATLLALELSRVGASSAPGAGRIDALPSAGPPWVVLVARQDGGPSATTLELRERMRSGVRLLAAPERLLLRGGAESVELRAVAVADGDDPEGMLLASRVAGLLGRTVAVSRPFGDPSGRPLAEADARATLEAAERLAERPAVARADRVAAYRLLGSLADLPDGARQARVLLEPLLVGGPALRRRRLQTLRVVLDRDAGAEAAIALGVHRNTVAYRVRAIERLGGWDLRDPELRLALSMALRIVPDAQLEGGSLQT